MMINSGVDIAKSSCCFHSFPTLGRQNALNDGNDIAVTSTSFEPRKVAGNAAIID
jgi:hypothetical protein